MTDDLAPPLDDIALRILDTARDLVLHFGYDKTTMNDIAKKAQVSKSTLYSRWNKKDALFEALLWHEGLKYTDIWIKRIQESDELLTFTSLFSHAFIALEDNAFMQALLKRNTHIMAIMRQWDLQKLYQRRIELWQNFLDSLKAVNAVRADINTHHVAYVASAVQLGILQMSELMADEVHPEPIALLQVTEQMMEAYLLPPDGGDVQAGDQVIRAFVAQMHDHVRILAKAGMKSDET